MKFRILLSDQHLLDSLHFANNGRGLVKSMRNNIINENTTLRKFPRTTKGYTIYTHSTTTINNIHINKPKKSGLMIVVIRETQSCNKASKLSLV